MNFVIIISLSLYHNNYFRRSCLRSVEPCLVAFELLYCMNLLGMKEMEVVKRRMLYTTAAALMNPSVV